MLELREIAYQEITVSKLQHYRDKIHEATKCIQLILLQTSSKTVLFLQFLQHRSQTLRFLREPSN